MAVRQRAGQVRHLCRQSLLPELAVGAVAVGRAPLLAEGVERADECRLMVARPRGDLAPEVLGEPDRVADQRDPLRLAVVPSAGELFRLLQREHGLAAASAAADLDPAKQPRDPQDCGLLECQAVGHSSALVGLRADVVRRGQPAGQDLGDLGDVVNRRDPLAVGHLLRVVTQPPDEVPLVALVVQRPPWQVGQREVLAEL